MMKPQSILLLSLLLCCRPLAAQDALALRPNQESISTPIVTCMAEDEDGYIWIGTLRGLNRYDGSSYRVWWQGDGALSDDAISCLWMEGEDVWVGTQSGLDRIRKGQAQHVFDNPRLQHIEELDHGHLAFSTREGLWSLDKETFAVQPLYLDRKFQYNTFSILAGGGIWLRNVAAGEAVVLGRDRRILREIGWKDRAVTGLCEAPD